VTKRFSILFLLVCAFATSHLKSQSRKDTAVVVKELEAASDSVKIGNYEFAIKTTLRNIPFVKDYNLLLAKCYRLAGGTYNRLAQTDSAIYYQEEALKLFTKLGDKKQVAQSYHNIGTVYFGVAEYEKALKNYIEAIKIREDIKDTIGLAWSQNNVGNIYWYQKAYDDALNHYIIARETFQKKNYPEGVGLTTGNIALIYETKGDVKKALEYFEEAINANTQAKNEFAVASNLCNLGALYFREKKYNEASQCYHRALEINERLQNYHGLSLTYSGMAALCDAKKDLNCSEKWLLKAVEVNNISGDKQSNVQTYRNLSSLYFQKGKYKDAFLALDKSYGLNDSLNTGDKLAEMEARYGKEKREKEIKLLQQENDIHQLEIKRKQTTIYASVIIGILVLIAAAFFIRNYLQKKKANKLLEEKNFEISNQKNIIEAKQKEVLDSIHYAKKIQTALIENHEAIKDVLKDSFIFHQPKDIVSGDFYWTSTIQSPNHQGRNLFYIAVCDSTGHGVPGAFMSLLNISFLNEAVNEKKIIEPNNVFNYVREKLIHSISKDGSQDGMDGIIFCFELDASRKILKTSYSAANNTPIIVRGEEIKQLSADKMPVGKGIKNEPFTLFTAELQPGDSLYLYTDGFADQFGGPKGKKFKYKQLNELLQSISRSSAEDQNKKLKITFEEWKGKLEQIDDVCLVGIRI
jgi:serine phosphatase RsbU (regulator of sigma subunit)